MTKPLRVLIVEDNEDDVLLLINALKDGGYEPVFERVDTSEGLKSALSQNEWDCILSDYSMPRYSGLAALREIREYDVDMPFILISGTIGEDTAVEAMKAGANDYLMKDKLARLCPALERELEEAEVRRIGRKAEKALQRKTRELSDFIEHANLGMHWVGTDGTILWANQAELDLLGYTSEEYIGHNIAEFHVDQQLVRHIMSLLNRGEALHDHEVRIQHRDGSIRHALLNSSAFLENGKLVHSRCFTHDITKRRQAEVALAESEMKYRRLVESMRDGLLQVDQDDIIQFVNQRFCEMFGYEANELIGKAAFELLLMEKDWQSMKEKNRLRTQGISERYEIQLKKKSGEYAWFQVSASPVEYPADKTGSLAIITDLTERRRMEDALRESREQLAQAQKIEAIGQLAGGIAHDFNNTLMAISGYSELLSLMLGPDSSLKEYIEGIQNALRQSATLTRQLLAFSRRQVLEMRILDLNHVVEETNRIVRPLMRENIEVVTICDPYLGPMKADPGQLQQVILNLAVNARDAMPLGGKLILKTSNVEMDDVDSTDDFALSPGNYIKLEVSDTGTGMDAATLSRIFEPFFTTKEEGKGTGMGLATVYGIVKQSGGTISAKSRQGSGTSFEIFFPRVDDAESVSGIKEAAGPSGQGARGETILLVDDNEPVRTALGALLQMQGYSVLQAADGSEALRMFEQYENEIHLVITDVVMPLMSGPELVKKLRVMRSSAKILYMSGYSDIHPISDEIAETSYLQKPATIAVLLRKIRELLDTETGK